MPGGKSDKNGVSHPNVSYQVASKHELEVIYEGVPPRTNKTPVFIVIGVVAVILIGAGVGVGLWQSGMFADDSKQEILEVTEDDSKVTHDSYHVTNQLSTTKTSVISDIIQKSTTQSTSIMAPTLPSKSNSSRENKQFESFTEKLSEVSTPIFHPEITTTSHQPKLILGNRRPRRQDNMLMWIMGSSDSMKHDHAIGEIIGKRKKRNYDGTCDKLEGWSPRFVKYLGTVYLPAIEAIVVCGYKMRYKGNSFKQSTSQQSCYIYYKHHASWHYVTLFEGTVFFEGAFVSWHNRLVLFGGNEITGKKKSFRRDIMVVEFNPVRDLFGMSLSDEDDLYYDGSGDEYAYTDDEPEDYHEGSGDDSDINDVKVSFVDNADFILEKFGPGVVEGCGVTLTESQDNVVFVVTGGQNDKMITMKKVMKIQLDLNSNDGITGSNQFLSEMNFERRQHGCYKTYIQEDETIVVAGGLDNRNSPVLEVEFLSTSSYSNWKVLGLLKLPRFGFPTVGQILGKLAIVGGHTYSTSNSDTVDIDSTNYQVVDTIEVYDDNLHNFRSAVITDQLDRTSVQVTSYNYYGVLFPKQWCSF